MQGTRYKVHILLLLFPYRVGQVTGQISFPFFSLSRVEMTRRVEIESVVDIAYTGFDRVD